MPESPLSHLCPGEYPWLLAMTALAIYLCVPETDQMAAIGVMVARPRRDRTRRQAALRHRRPDRRRGDRAVVGPLRRHRARLGDRRSDLCVLAARARGVSCALGAVAAASRPPAPATVRCRAGRWCRRHRRRSNRCPPTHHRTRARRRCRCRLRVRCAHARRGRPIRLDPVTADPCRRSPTSSIRPASSIRRDRSGPRPVRRRDPSAWSS